MGHFTGNLNLYVPDVGEVNWGLLVDANWNILDAITSGSAFGAPRVQGLVGINTPGNPTTRYDLSADVIVLRSPSTGLIVVRPASGVLTCNLGVVGVNGIDSGVQVLNTWYHFYFIWNGATLATLASTGAPPTGPTLLPATYTFWAYAGAIRSNASVQLIATVLRGNAAFFVAQQQVLSAGAATTETVIALAAVVPPNATEVQLQAELACPRNAVVVGDDTLSVRVVAGAPFLTVAQTRDTFGQGNLRNVAVAQVPNVGQQVLYLVQPNSSGGTPPNANVFVLGYTLANGGS